MWTLLKQETLPEGFLIYTDFQTSGKGQIENSWESEPGKNLLFSILLYPHHIAIDKQFIIAQIVSNSIINVLTEFCEGLTIKWPNDIYVNDKKIAGILIENSLRGTQINHSIIGIGLNVNQTDFISDAPNPVSLKQIVRKSLQRKGIMKRIFENILSDYNEMNLNKIRESYYKNLYRNDGLYTFKSENETFKARIESVKPDGKINMTLENGSSRSFYFKEVEFII
jgi:BirA family biotin operon repressor/biotin-[acetyl-CoA-carboxylase] ligase